MNNVSESLKMFTLAWHKAENTIEFSESWRNGTGYYDYATELDLAPGEIAKSTSSAPNSRRLLFIGTRVGTIVLFERYSPRVENGEEIRSNIIVGNYPDEFLRIFVGVEGIGNALTGQGVQFLAGNFGMNIGQRMETLFSMIE